MKKVLFVTSQPEVSSFMYDIFHSDPDLKSEYFIEGTSSTREDSVSTVRKKLPDLVVFFEKTAGILTLSRTLYQIRMTGARVIYISSKRSAGDLVLESLVGYGIYDIVLIDEIRPDIITDIVLNPRGFQDVSIFHREVDIPDSTTGKNKSFIIPNLELARQFSTTMDDDFLTDPVQKIINKIPERVNSSEDERNIKLSIFGFNKKKKAKKAPLVNKTQPKQEGLGDFD